MDYEASPTRDDTRFLGQASTLSIVCLIAFCWLPIGLLMHRVGQPSGDERFYVTTARAWAGLVGVGPTPNLDFETLEVMTVGRGWFLPGTSALLGPGALADLSVADFRIYMAFFNLMLLIAAANELSKVFGVSVGRLFLFATGLFPTTAVFAFTMWGDLPAALLLVIGLSRTFRWGKELQTNGVVPRWSGILTLAGLLSVIIYVRPSLALTAPTFLITLGAAGFRTLDKVAFLRGLVPKLAGLTIGVFALVLPWSAVLSANMGSPYLLTSSTDLSWIRAFGDPDDVAEIGGFVEWHNYVLARSAETGESYGDVTAAERDRIADNVTSDEYWHRVTENYQLYLLAENRFLSRFHRMSLNEVDEPTWDLRLMPRLLRVNTILWFSLLALATTMTLTVAPGRYHWQNVVAKPVMIASLVFPLIVSVHSRHIVDFVPLMIASAAVGVGDIARDTVYSGRLALLGGLTRRRLSAS